MSWVWSDLHLETMDWTLRRYALAQKTESLTLNYNTNKKCLYFFVHIYRHILSVFTVHLNFIGNLDVSVISQDLLHKVT